jgi:uncharacterized protein (DUF58 family)
MLSEVWLLISGLLVFIGLVASEGLLLVVGSMVIVIWVLARFWDRHAFLGVTHSRNLSRRRAFIGDSLEYTVTLANEKLLPLIWVDIQDVFPIALELPGATLRGRGSDVTRNHSITTSLLPYQRVSWKYHLRCQARGYHRIGPVRLRSGDIFGFTAGETQFPSVEHILVYPRIVDLRQLTLPSKHPLGETRGQQPIHQDPTRFMGLRDYQPTDPLKHVDWKATARRLNLQTKLFEPVVSLNVLIALNAATREHAWQGTSPRLFERAVTAAASVANYAADRKYSFGLVSNAAGAYSGKWISVPFSGSASQLTLVLEALAMAGPHSLTSLVEVLRLERGSLPPGATVALITSVVTAALAREVAEIRARGYQLIELYTGDGSPEINLPGVTVYSIGRALAALEEDMVPA